MKKLSKEKQTQLVLVAMLTVGAIAGLWFGLIAMQENKKGSVIHSEKDVQAEIEKMQHVITNSAQVQMELKEATNNLSKIEGTMASGDLYSWIVSAIKQFNVPSYKVEMPQFGAPAVGEVRVLPDFPYRQASVSVSGTAYYWDLGKFLADLENHFPHVRVQNLSLEPGLGTNPEEHERLNFRMEIVTLVKPTAS